MTYDMFVDLMGKLSGWTNKKLNDIQREVYWNEISKIPDTAFGDIIKNLIKNTPPSGKLPTPDQISLQWYHWLQAHPNHRMVEYPQTDCPECDGEGCFTVWYHAIILPPEHIKNYENLEAHKSWNKMFVPCSQCQNWRRVFPTKGTDRPRQFYTRRAIIDRGWKFLDPYMENFLKCKQEYKKRIQEKRDLDYLADKP